VYNFIRIGTVGFPSSKYLDIFKFEKINKLTFIIFESEINGLDDLYKAAEFFKINIEDKIEVKYVRQTWLHKQFMRVINKFFKSELLFYYLSGLHFSLKKNVSEDDILWTGDNDFENTNRYVKCIKKNFNNFLIRTYKETRHRVDNYEKNALDYADLLVLPNNAYFDFFKELYNLDLQDKSIIADLDWRYSGNIKYLNKLKVEKLSQIDGKFHVCILAGRVIWDKNEKRSANRYYYVDTIKKLIDLGIIVHIHARVIIKSNDNPIYEKNNPYELLVKTGKVFIEDMTLYAGSKDYDVLKSYDAGLLHPLIDDTEENIKVKKFQEINIPNRFYEYTMAGVMSIVEKGAGYEMEKIINDNDFGIVYDNEDDLKSKIEQHKNKYKKFDFSFDQLLSKILHSLDKNKESKK
jgi:hypothetical protein